MLVVDNTKIFVPLRRDLVPFANPGGIKMTDGFFFHQLSRSILCYFFGFLKFLILTADTFAFTLIHKICWLQADHAMLLQNYFFYFELYKIF